ncbi:MAG: Txe/YoeB family addiction module toxin [Prevotellaceae bacterium]|jgi:toxin YoeB|nr:Txe/YoeB family addiction module toxin [Prevotellaceae bacterium]
MIYSIGFTQQAKADISLLKKSEPDAFKKLEKLLIEIIEHPTSGTGKPEKLRHELSDCYSRRITQKHRLVYQVFEDIVEILVISAYKHYGDK